MMGSRASGGRTAMEIMALSHRGKRIVRWRPGERTAYKRRFWKRMRCKARGELKASTVCED